MATSCWSPFRPPRCLLRHRLLLLLLRRPALPLLQRRQRRRRPPPPPPGPDTGGDGGADTQSGSSSWSTQPAVAFEQAFSRYADEGAVQPLPVLQDPNCTGLFFDNLDDLLCPR